jgi:quercetin dioxygenase-like cupin family protein
VVTDFNAGFAEHGIEVSHFMPGSDGVYIKQVKIPAGKMLSMHAHTFTHKSVLACGDGWLTVDGEPRLLRAPAVLSVEAGRKHEFSAVSDCVWMCVHATNETDPDRIDHTLVKES